MAEKTRIIGLDPGLRRCGYAVIDYDGRCGFPVEYGFIKTDSDLTTSSRLHEISCELERIISEHKPSEFAIERVYFHRNVSTAIDIAMVMGAGLALAVRLGLNTSQYSPLQIKRAIVGTGRADKRQVQLMVQSLYSLEEKPKPPDVADALAVALCHAHLMNAPQNVSVG